VPATPQVEFGGNKPGEVRRFGDLGWGVDSLAFAPGGAVLAAGKSDDALLLFDVVNNGRLDFLDKLKMLGKVSACSFTPNGSRLLAGGQTGQIAIYDVSREGRLTEAGQFVGHSKEIKCIAVSSDSRFALSGSMEEKVRLWEIATGREQAVFAGFKGGVKAVHIAKNGRTAMANQPTSGQRHG
jgi:WD40 repeat protein